MLDRSAVARASPAENPAQRYSEVPTSITEESVMNRNAFTESLTKEGFPDAVVVTREANAEMAVHEHPFEAKALILEGEMSIRVGDEERAYHVGEVFHLLPNKPHSERYGPNGVTYLVGRKQ
ncbi:conserved hypothetical protein [Paraburkholderia xenovorans LB400]|uniref:Cupin type-2 domain-containing protein n=2 Tax=Paraburkholderia xenovorans TaxID=36873 RepID=Q13JK6_PARXL|nr:conserved hypothetical protein [Paraburkholderia xenovorans LB400]